MGVSGVLSAGMTRRAVLVGLASLAMPRTQGESFADHPARRQLSKGVNIPDWAVSTPLSEPAPDVLLMLRHLGFTYVRLPLNSDDWTGDTSDIRAAHRALEDALAALERADLASMVDFHPSEKLRQLAERAPISARGAVMGAWQTIAPRLAHYAPAMVFPELLNEPPFERTHWLGLRDDLIAEVRSACPDHTIIWGADRYQTIGETMGMPLPDDPNTVVAIHYYTPMSFTHQCADWDQSGLARISGLPFPAAADTPAVRALSEKLSAAADEQALAMLNEDLALPWTARRIHADLEEIANWAAAAGTTVLLNEFGVLKACVDTRSRDNWIGAVRASAEAHGIGWGYWELDHGFGFLQDRQSLAGLDVSLLAALTGGGR